MIAMTKPKRKRGERGTQIEPTSSRTRALVRSLFDSAPRDEWLRVLTTHPLSSPAGKLAALMGDPAYSKHSPESLCREAGVTYNDLVDLYRQHKVGEAVIQAASRHVGRFVDDLGEDSRSLVAVCQFCWGECRIVVPSRSDPSISLEVACPQCAGTGTVRRPGDAASRKLFAQVLGAVEERSGPIVQNNIQINGNGHSDRVSRGQRIIESARVTSVRRVPDDEGSGE